MRIPFHNTWCSLESDLRLSRGQTPSENSSDALDLPRTAGMSPSGADGGPVAPHSEGQVPPLGQLLDQSGRQDHREDPTLPSDGVGSSSEAEREIGEMTDARGDDTSRGATRRVANLQMDSVLRSVDLPTSPLSACARSLSMPRPVCCGCSLSRCMCHSVLLCACASQSASRLVLQLRAPWSLHSADELVCGHSLFRSADAQCSARNGQNHHTADEDGATRDNIHAIANSVW